ncbi:TadE/TadG family protein [Mesorhizobium sp. M1E.F.Ca.ET.045.02.1.1]|uniref:pilus assembly protein n=2 Tax=Mesorhizobium TaxID=68287 RepID=UPI000F75AE70|nr:MULTISPECIES: pilus assembly protein [unclassified Mesorhizobium]AZO24327.1 TadE/TadG family protein [Mesorhizobium sp. M1E.F.Ca.ET.045.02.1.1]RUW82255.1 TadE/TadG family protein [Mesorhizobium sp. M1E.F.Ca.ET.063.01.1.1]RWD84271.1 MAG: TadE/TadG family protein [Mesorhizobium sp.]TKB12020.1 MAG: TadE/TadG family protein [Mesorhizobium sp.]
MREFWRRFCRDRRGNYALVTAIAMVPLMGAVALAVDFSELNRQKQMVLNALDAANFAAARRLAEGATDDQIKAYAVDFFNANLNNIDPANVSLDVTLPSNQAGGGLLTMSATLNYHPYFYPASALLVGVSEADANKPVKLDMNSQVRLKNTLEVAMVLDNSGSMSTAGTGTGQKRIDLLKQAAKQLVDTLAQQAAQIKQIDKPVQFSLVPFAASVNVGPRNDNAPWMDTYGLSPIANENFDWSTLSASDKHAEKINGIWYKKGTGWGAEEGQILTRFELYRDMKVVTSHERIAGSKRVVCDEYRDNHTCKRSHDEYDYVDTYGPFASWQGCVEVRPYPYNVDDTPASGSPNNTGTGEGDPATMFVPMFAPDEPGNHWYVTQDPDEPKPVTYGAANSWWNDEPSSTTGKTRQSNMAKYFQPRPMNAPVLSKGAGPNYSCTTTPITPLTDVTNADGLAAIKAAIDLMVPNGNTNVPEGMAWGWRTVSSAEPFTEGRLETERGNDKVVIVLTDGENTYSTVSSDPAGNKSTYAAYGYTGVGYNGTSVTRLFGGTSSDIGQFNYTSGNYTAAMNEQMAKLCDNAKAGNIMVMTVALDMSSTDADDKKAMDALKACSSDSRFRKDPADPSKPAKLLWNATGATLSDNFKEIANELSNLRVVG